MVVNQRTAPPIQRLFVSLGEYSFTKEIRAVVKVSNNKTDGYVIADAVQFLPVD